MNSKKTILIIDDDETMKEALNVLFQEEGFEVHHLSSGYNIANWLSRHIPDIILTDYLMPGKNGAEVTRMLRSREDTKDIPIIMLAATRHYDKAGYEAGVDKFIAKPFDIDYLLRQIRYYLGE